MTAEAVFARLRRRPFVAFRIHLSGGNYYDVLHPEMMFVSKSGITLAIYDSNPSPEQIPAREVLISFLHVTSTEDLPAPNRAAG